MPDRLFLGIPLPPAARDDLAAQLRRCFPRGLPGRAVPPENWHLTVRFLGATAPEAAERIRAELAAAPLGASFHLTLRELGAFPRPARATVIWLGAHEGAEEMRRLAGSVGDALWRAGVAREERPFAAHLTLARLPRPADVRQLVGAGGSPALRLRIEEVVLYRSHLGHGPPRYEPMQRLPL
ncbi:MAG TPA: RNA 2',3'-cyclic phosphodiesterase [Longimicrobiaceae bacterium]